jgi:hypothetical protein
MIHLGARKTHLLPFTTFAPGDSKMSTTTRRRLRQPVRSARWLERPAAGQPGVLEVVAGREAIRYTVKPTPVSQGAAWELNLDGRIDGFILACDGRQRCFCRRWQRSERCEHIEGLKLASAQKQS